jgi:hypothetical protein
MLVGKVHQRGKKMGIREDVLSNVIPSRVARLESNLVRIRSFTHQEAELAEYLMTYMDGFVPTSKKSSTEIWIAATCATALAG